LKKVHYLQESHENNRLRGSHDNTGCSRHTVENAVGIYAARYGEKGREILDDAQ
jgi:hypothetical protein